MARDGNTVAFRVGSPEVGFELEPERDAQLTTSGSSDSSKGK